MTRHSPLLLVLAFVIVAIVSDCGGPPPAGGATPLTVQPRPGAGRGWATELVVSCVEPAVCARLELDARTPGWSLVVWSDRATPETREVLVRAEPACGVRSGVIEVRAAHRYAQSVAVTGDRPCAWMPVIPAGGD